MMDIGVIEGTHYLENRIHRADMREELVPESFPFGCSLHETRDIDEFDGCRDYFRTIDYCSDLL